MNLFKAPNMFAILTFAISVVPVMRDVLFQECISYVFRCKQGKHDTLDMTRWIRHRPSNHSFLRRELEYAIAHSHHH